LLECLEDRTVPSTITWTNRGQASDNFAAVFGSDAALARSVVDTAIGEWTSVIGNFNQSGGGNNINVTITMNTAAGSTGGVTNVTFGSDNKPRSATISLGRTGDGSNPWYLNPTLFSSAFLGTPTNAFSGYAQFGSPAFGRGDLQEVVAHELGHAMGFESNTRVNALSHDTGVADTSSGGGIGHYYAFVGAGGFRCLLTSFNSGNPGTDAHGGEHFASGDSLDFAGNHYDGADDLMNPYYGFGQRHIVSRNDAFVLRDAMGYTVTDPATALGTFYAVRDEINRLTVRGVLDRTSADSIILGTHADPVLGNLIDVNVSLGSPAPGTFYTGSYFKSFSFNSVSSIEVYTGTALSSVTVLHSSTAPIYIRGGQTIVTLGTNHTTQTVLAPVTLDGFASTNLILDDSADMGNRTITFANSGGTTFGQITGLTPPGATITYRNSIVSGISLDTGTGTETVNVYSSPIGQLTLQGHSGNTTVNVGNSDRGLQDIRGDVKLQGNFNGRFTLNVDDSGNSNPVTARQILPGMGFDIIHGLAPQADILYRGVQTSAVHITLGSGANTFTVENTNTAGDGSATTLDTGTGNAVNTVNVLATNGTTPLIVVGHGPNTTVNVRNPARGLRDILGQVKLQGNFVGRTALVVDNTGDDSPYPDARQILPGMGFDIIHNLAPADILYRGVQTGAVNIILGSGANTFTVENTNTAGDGSATTLDTGTGNAVNTVNVLRTDATTPLTVVGHGPNVTLVGPTAPTGFYISGSNAGNLSGGASASFSNIQNLTGGSGNDAFLFADGAGVDGNISDVVGGANSLDFSAYSTPVTVNLAASTATGVGGTVQNILTLRGGAGDDSLTGNAAARTIFFASPGNDSVTGLGTDNFLYNADANGTADSTWSVTARNSGTLTVGASTTTFSGVQNLYGGGSGAATFVFADGAGVDGNISGGGGGTNTLDYRAYSTSVIVDLWTGFATGVGGSVSGITVVFGGTGNGALGAYNLLIGNGGNVLTGGTGRRNILVAGGTASTLNGGDQDDLLIAGSTAYDTEAGLVSWQAIAAYWAGADDYPTRVANLTSGTGVPLLDATTVFGNGGGNFMNGNGELALIYSDGLDNFTLGPPYPPGFDPNSVVVPITP
jgi:hypothetical protein